MGIMRTSIDNCYQRWLNRYQKEHPNCSQEELNDYANHKKSIYKWYKGSNRFLEKIDQMNKVKSK